MLAQVRIFARVVPNSVAKETWKRARGTERVIRVETPSGQAQAPLGIEVSRSRPPPSHLRVKPGTSGESRSRYSSISRKAAWAAHGGTFSLTTI